MVHGSDLYLAIIVGIFLTLIYTELTGVLPGGLIVPGYLALCFGDPIVLLTILVISCLTYLIVVHVVARFVILYGRRKFAAMLSVAIILKLIMDFFYPVVPFQILELSGVGVIVPGIIANTYQKQGFIHTTLSTLLLSTLTFGIIFGYSLIV
ncbi:MAG: poly-gamma-glutamate biosynthesis protein PgsC [Bacillota bacterium]